MTPMPETDTAPASSAQRANLAAAIATVHRWEKYIAHCRDVGLVNLDAEVNERARPLVAAQDALHELEAEGPARSALKHGLKGEIGSSLEAARRAVEAAEAAYLDACQQRALAQAEISRHELGDLHRAKYAAREALGSLLAAAPGIIGLLNELHTIWRRQRTIEAALDEIWKIPGTLRPHWNARRPEDEVPDPQLAAQWRDVIAKLLMDPAAPLPGGDPTPQPEAAAA
jgi:hypothetical protein